jgi:hypothetical protein
VLRGNDEVGGERQLEATAGRDAVDGGDDGLDPGVQPGTG